MDPPGLRWVGQPEYESDVALPVAAPWLFLLTASIGAGFTVNALRPTVRAWELVVRAAHAKGDATRACSAANGAPIGTGAPVDMVRTCIAIRPNNGVARAA